MPETTQAPEPIKVALVDDHPLFLQGLAAAIARSGDMVLVAEGQTAADAIAIAHDLGPDVLLVDVQLPGNGLEAARHISRHNSRVKLIVMTGAEDDDLVDEALSAGASGFLDKTESTGDLHQAIRTVHAGQRFLSHALASRLVFDAHARRNTQHRKTALELSGRERQIMKCIARGLSNTEISDQFGLSPRTVGNYVSGIYSKMGATNRCAAILLYRRLCSEATAL